MEREKERHYAAKDLSAWLEGSIASGRAIPVPFTKLHQVRLIASGHDGWVY